MFCRMSDRHRAGSACDASPRTKVSVRAPSATDVTSQNRNEFTSGVDLSASPREDARAVVLAHSSKSGRPWRVGVVRSKEEGDTGHMSTNGRGLLSTHEYR